MDEVEDSRVLPFQWYLVLGLFLLIGIILIYFNPIIPVPLQKLLSCVQPDKWSLMIGIYSVSIALTHIFVYYSLEVTRSLFKLQDTHLRKNMWPPALLGLCESIMYPTAFLYGKPDFIGLWLLLKVAGNWPRWGLKTEHMDSNNINKAIHEGRRRYYQFLIGSALMVLFSLVTYGVIKIYVLK